MNYKEQIQRIIVEVQTAENELFAAGMTTDAKEKFTAQMNAAKSLSAARQNIFSLESDLHSEMLK